MSKDEKAALLIVEDDPGCRKQMRWSFDANDTVVASDREGALAQLRRYEPAVVTLDLGLPPDSEVPPKGSPRSSRYSPSPRIRKSSS